MSDFPNTGRGQSLAIIDAVLRRKHPLDDVLDGLPGSADLDPRDRAMTRRIVMTVLRRRGQIDLALAERLTGKMPRQRHLRDILRIGAAELLFLETPAYAAVDGCVELAKQVGRQHHAGFINGVLRALTRQPPQDPNFTDAGRINTPDWLLSAWQTDFGAAQAAHIAAAHLIEPPLDLSVKSDAEGWAARLDGVALSATTVRLPNRGPVPDLPGFADGEWWVQDAAAALPVRLLGDVSGQAVLDLCAAPGGKTAQLVAAGARVVAVDRSPRRLERLRGNLTRLRLSAELVEAGVLSYEPPQLFSSVLLDAPCSATGTIRRHPDIPYRRSPADIDRASEVQRRMLRRAIEFVEPGGQLIYAVCSLQAAEGPAQIDALIEGGAPVVLEPVTADDIGGLSDCVDPRGWLQTLPSHLADAGGMDGFFAARLRRT